MKELKLFGQGSGLISNKNWKSEHLQSILNCQKKVKPYKAVTQEHIQMFHDGNNHQFLITVH